MSGLITNFKRILSGERMQGNNTIASGRGDSPRQDGPNIPAPEELYNMALQAIEKHFDQTLNELVNSGELEGYWRHPLEELMYSGAFDDKQVSVLQEELRKKTHTISVTHARVLATRILCGVEDGRQPKGLQVQSNSAMVEAISKWK